MFSSPIINVMELINYYRILGENPPTQACQPSPGVACGLALLPHTKLLMNCIKFNELYADKHKTYT